MDHYFRSDVIRQRLRVGPLSSYLDTFAQHLSEHGYAIDTGRGKLRSVSRLSQWMDRRGLQAHDLSEQVLKRFLADRRRQARLRRTDPRALDWFLEHLRQTGALEPSSPRCVDDRQRRRCGAPTGSISAASCPSGRPCWQTATARVESLRTWRATGRRRSRRVTSPLLRIPTFACAAGRQSASHATLAPAWW